MVLAVTWPAVVLWPRCGSCEAVLRDCSHCGEEVCEHCSEGECPECLDPLDMAEDWPG